MKNPVLTASGTFGFGREYNNFYNIGDLGAVCIKGLTLNERDGNKPSRVAETPGGMLNSVGLQNPGVHAFIRDELPFLRSLSTVIIANINGNTIEEYCEIAEVLSHTGVDMLELNISCPNVKQGGIAFGVDSNMVERITSEVKKHSEIPIIVKLSPNVTDISEMAIAAEAGGADALSLINTLLGMRIDIKTRRPILHNNTGGLSGPAVKPVAVRMVWQVKNSVSIPIIGMGGISTGDDAIEFMLAGATAVAVGTACFMDPFAPINVLNGIESYMKENKIEDVNELVGAVKPY